MEELRSTDILDKEIQEDARKKAEKILKNAELEASQILKSLQSRLEQAASDKKERLEKKIEMVKRDLDAALPLEKERFKISFIQKAIDSAFNEYFSSLSEKALLQLILSRLSLYKDKTEGKSFTLYYYGFEEKALREEISKSVKISAFEKTEFNKIIPEKDFSFSKNYGVILEESQGQLRIRLSLSEFVSQIEEKYREELCSPLFEGKI